MTTNYINTISDAGDRRISIKLSEPIDKNMEILTCTSVPLDCPRRRRSKSKYIHCTDKSNKRRISVKTNTATSSSSNNECWSFANDELLQKKLSELMK